MKKVIALLPFRNEEIFLPTYMQNMVKIADCVLGYDDRSTDNSRQIFLDSGGQLVRANLISSGVGATKQVRDLLLDEGRKMGGSHFIILDADEFFCGATSNEIRHSILELEPGEKLRCYWLMLSSNPNYVLGEGSVWKPGMKDFAFGDTSSMNYPENNFVHFSRTPVGPRDKYRDISLESFAVIHLQFHNWELGQIKQCWYRVQECLNIHRNYVHVNKSYAFTKEVPTQSMLKLLPPQYTDTLQILPLTSVSQFHPRDSWYFRAIVRELSKHKLNKIRNLDIWFLPIMRKHYWERYRKEHTFSIYLDFLNRSYLRIQHLLYLLRVLQGGIRKKI